MESERIRLLQNVIVTFLQPRQVRNKFLTDRERAVKPPVSSSHPATNAG
jgi:hypothetical protein